MPYTDGNLGDNHDKKRLFGSHSHYWKDNIKKYFEEVVLEYVDCICLAVNGDHLCTVLETLI